MEDKAMLNQAVFWFIVSPFIASAAIEFAPWWIYAPVCLFMAFMFVGSWKLIRREANDGRS